jgi:hypothetical protein
VDGLHVQGVTEDKMDLLSSTQVSKPIPSEHALHTYNQVFPKRSDSPEKQFGIGPKVPV